MDKKEEKGIFKKVAAMGTEKLMAGIFICFIIIILLLSVSLAPRLMNQASTSLSGALYSIFVPASNATMTADKKIINSGDDFIINFKKVNETAGFFTVSYSCDISAKLFSLESNGLKDIKCGEAYYLLENETAINIRAEGVDDVTRLVIDGSFENNDTQKSEKVGVVRVTVKNTSATAPTDTTNTDNNDIIPNPTPIKIGGNTPTPIIETIVNPALYYGTGKADLAIRLLQVGVINNAGAIIASRNQFSSNEQVGIKFEIRNDGSTITGPWYFTANLPSLSTPTYNSNTQVSLKPGESIFFTLGFSNLTQDYNEQIRVTVDPLNQVNEGNESNNILLSNIINLSYNDNNYYNNNDDIQVSCYGEPNDPQTGERVRWYADVTGGDGDYTYDWTGTNSLNSSAENPTKTYSSTGTKKATVTVTDGNDNEATDTCSVYVD
jgi:hypothetical protein